MMAIPPPDPGIEYVVASRGMSKGTAQTEGVQVLVRPEVSFGHGFVAAYAKNVSTPAKGWETGALIGLRPKWASIDWTISAAYKRLVDMPSAVDEQAAEFTVAGKRKFGPATLNLNFVYSPDELGTTKESLYVEGGAVYSLTPTTRLLANVGRRERTAGPEYVAWNLGVARNVYRGIAVDIRYYDTDRGELGYAYKSRIVAAVRASF